MANLLTLRTQRRWTQAMLSAATNHRVSAATISRIERGEVSPERSTCEALAVALHVQVEDIEWPTAGSRDSRDSTV